MLLENRQYNNNRPVVPFDFMNHVKQWKIKKELVFKNKSYVSITRVGYFMTFLSGVTLCPFVT